MLVQRRTREPGMPRGLRLRPGSGPKLLGAVVGVVLVLAPAPQLRDGRARCGIAAKVVSERLGHATIAITMDTYSHVLPGLDERAADVVARLILGDDGSS